MHLIVLSSEGNRFAAGDFGAGENGVVGVSIAWEGSSSEKSS